MGEFEELQRRVSEQARIEREADLQKLRDAQREERVRVAVDAEQAREWERVTQVASFIATTLQKRRIAPEQRIVEDWSVQGFFGYKTKSRVVAEGWIMSRRPGGFYETRTGRSKDLSLVLLDKDSSIKGITVSGAGERSPDATSDIIISLGAKRKGRFSPLADPRPEVIHMQPDESIKLGLASVANRYSISLADF